MALAGGSCPVPNGEVPVRFQCDHETFYTRDMIRVEINGISLCIYLCPERSLAFIQTFDDEQGLMIRRASDAEKIALLGHYESAPESDISSWRRLAECLFSRTTAVTTR